MKPIDLFWGVLLGIAGCAIGAFLFIVLFTDHGFVSGLQALHEGGELGKLITLGAVVDLLLFFLLLRANRDLMARGVVLALILLTILTLVV